MGKYLNSEYNDYSELYLIDNNLPVGAFYGHNYMLWMNKKRRRFRELNNMVHGIRLSAPKEYEFRRWLEKSILKSRKNKII